MMVPRVSVLMAVHNGAAFLPQTLASIAWQTLDDFEFVIVDDASSDATPLMLATAAMEDERVRVIRNPANLGLTASLNIGLAACRGEYVARIDADDVATHDRLAVQVALLDSRPDHALVGGREIVIDADGRKLRTGRANLGPEAAAWCAHFAPPFVHSSAMWRRSVGLTYDEGFRTAQDFDLWQRLMEHGPAVRLDIPLVALREHSASISHTRKAQQSADAAAIATRALARLVPEDEAGQLAACVIAGAPGGGRIVEVALAAEAEFLARSMAIEPADTAAVRRITVSQLLKGAARATGGAGMVLTLLRRRPLATLAEIAAIIVRRWN